MEGRIVMSKKELARARILEHVITDKITLKQASLAMNVCYRQAWRVKERYKKYGPEGLVHKNRGKTSKNALSCKLRDRIVDLFKNSYFDCNDTHFTELLAEREKIKVGRETVRKTLRSLGIKPKRKRRPPQHRSRRPRKEQIGTMALWDGSPHHWFGAGKPACCFMAALDDATGDLLAGLFIEAESSVGYLKLLDMIFRRHGVPINIYHDRHSSLQRCDDHWSLEEQLQGHQFPTHVGRVLQEACIESIPAYSPQAKGRIERHFGTVQDRMIPELRLSGITDTQAANRWLQDYFIDRYNKRFGVKPSKTGIVFRKISKQDIYNLVTFAYEAVVANDNCVRLGGLTIDIPAGAPARSFAKKKVLVKQHIDGAWTVWFQDKIIAKHKPTPFKEPIRSWKRRTPVSKSSTKGAKEAIQLYITSKPVPPGNGHFPLAVNMTY